MQEIDDLKEIFTATHDLGVAWQNEIVKLRAENKTLADNYTKLSDENKKLHDELLKVRNDIINELNTRNSDDFQKEVKDYLKKIRECVGGSVAFEKPKENPAPAENMIAEKEIPAANEEKDFEYD